MQPPSTLRKGIALTLLTVMGFGSLAVFGNVAIELIRDISSASPSIILYKGGLYFLGAGLLLTATLLLYLLEVILNKTLSSKIKNAYTIFSVGAFVVALALPHVVHYFLSGYLHDKQYFTCDEVEKQWLHDHTISYVNSKEACNQLILKEEEKLKEIHNNYDK